VINRRLLVLALVALIPNVAPAQFTTFIPPRDKQKDSAKAAVVAERRQEVARRDSVTTAALTNMKARVDSAAGAPPLVRADTVTRLGSTIRADSVVRVAKSKETEVNETTTFRNGSPAPATATVLPILALLGGASVAVGAVLLYASRARGA